MTPHRESADPDSFERLTGEIGSDACHYLPRRRQRRQKHTPGSRGRSSRPTATCLLDLRRRGEGGLKHTVIGQLQPGVSI